MYNCIKIYKINGQKHRIFNINYNIITAINLHMEVLKCNCPTGSEFNEDEDGMLICGSCGGWIEGQN